MKFKTKTKIGILFFVAKWFKEIVPGSDNNSKKFTVIILDDTKK